MKWYKSFPFRIFMVAFLLRLIPVLLSYNLAIGLDDMFQYDMLARSLAAGNGYRWYAQEDLDLILPYLELDVSQVDYEPIGILASHRAPMYPFFLAAVYFVFGLERRFFAARLVQAAVGALLAPLTYALARRLFPGEDKIGRFAAWGVAVYPYFVFLPLALATENIFILLVLGGLVAMLKAGESRRWQDWVMAGICLGLATLTRSVVVFFVPFAMLWAWVWAKDRKGALLVPLCVLALTLPWAVRNSRLHGEPTFVETGMGYNMYLGYHPQGSGSFEFGISLDLLTIVDDAERHHVGMAKAWEFIRADPGRVPALMAHKLGRFFGLERRELTFFYTNNFFGFIPLPGLLALFLAAVLPFTVLSLLSAWGLPFLRWDKGAWLGAFLVFSYLVPHIIILAEPRFHLTLLPWLAVLTGYAWVGRTRLWVEMRLPANRARLAAAILLMGLLLYNWSLELYLDADKLAILFSPQGNLGGFPY
jgi:4-amino-4-deoxy-L-arabinose transferase-like glycosyltransferase